MQDLTREELVLIVRRIISAQGTESEQNELIKRLCDNVPHPQVTDLIFYSDKQLTPEQIVDAALAYKATHI